MYCLKIATAFLVLYLCHLDIDECSHRRDNCSQYCTNTIGSFECGCRQGYQLHLGAQCRGMWGVWWNVHGNVC